MSDTEATTTTTDQQPTEAPHGTEIDWKAEARKWEDRAKKNKDAADELERLKTAQMSDTEKLVKRAEDAERLVSEYQAREQHSNDATEIAAKTNVPYSLLVHCGTREDMEQFAKEYAAANHVSSAPPAPQSRIRRSTDGTNVEPTRAQFQDFMNQYFNR